MKALRGFTLVELLLVVGIIGVLMAVIIPNIGSARASSRDAKRIADLRNIELALKNYYVDYQRYPCSIYATSGNAQCPQFAGVYMAPVPRDPLNSSREYNYTALRPTSSITTCGNYHLGAALETAHTELANDADAASGILCSGATGGALFSGLSAGGTVTVATPSSHSATSCNNSTGTAAPGGTERCYDVSGF